LKENDEENPCSYSIIFVSNTEDDYDDDESLIQFEENHHLNQIVSLTFFFSTINLFTNLINDHPHFLF
jgi:hypothetical protein